MPRASRCGLALWIALACVSTAAPAAAQSGSASKHSPAEVVGCLVTVNALIAAGRIPNAAPVDRLTVVVAAAAYEHEITDIPDDVARRFLALHDELWAATNALPDASRLDILAQRLPACGAVLTAVDAHYQAMMARANEEAQKKIAAARASFLDAQYEWLQEYMKTDELYRDDGATRAESHSWYFNSQPERFHFEIGVAADPRTVKEEALADRFCPSPEQAAEYCRLRAGATPVAVRVKKDLAGKEVDGPLVLCLVNSLKAELGPEIDRVPLLVCDGLP